MTKGGQFIKPMNPWGLVFWIVLMFVLLAAAGQCEVTP